MTAANLVSPADGGTCSRGSRYQTLSGLRDAHLALRTSSMEAQGAGGAASRADRIRKFLAEARQAGANLSGSKERRAAQGILDYWSAEVAGLPGAKGDDLAPVLLAAYDPAGMQDNASQPPPADKSDQRALIRFSAFAREWQASGREPGYLLTGEAITQAARFRDLDAGIEDLLAASETAADAQRRRTQIFMVAATFLSVVALSIVGVLTWQFWYLGRTESTYIASLKSSAGDQIKALRWLQRYQLWRPPYELSGIRQVEKVTLSGLRLYAPNFADVPFKNVKFPSAQLAGASFNQGQFSVERAGEKNDLTGANLRQAQFRNARIASTSFAGADLYRAVFDRATLCQVDFSGANLRAASFWAATLDEETRRSLSNTAWWLAVGWPWSHIESLAQTNREDPERNGRLSASVGFTADVQRGIDALHIAAPGTPERALALNDIAWTRAVWGIDLFDRGKQQPGALQTPRAASRSESCDDEGTPNDARDAAERATCIVNRLNTEGERKGLYVELLANLRDTLAYIEMQRGEMNQAYAMFQQINGDFPEFFQSGESMFRIAIAQYFGSEEKEKALINFNAAVGEKAYQPTHELQTLRDYIFTVPAFVAPLKASVEKLWPSLFGAGPSSSPVTSTARYIRRRRDRTRRGNQCSSLRLRTRSQA